MPPGESPDGLAGLQVFRKQPAKTGCPPPPLQPTYATYLPTLHAFEFCAKVACSFSNSKPRHIGTSSKYSRKRNFAQVAFCMACSRLTWALLWHRARAQSPLLLRPSALDPGARLKSHIDIFERRKRSCAVLGDGASWNSTGGAPIVSDDYVIGINNFRRREGTPGTIDVLFVNRWVSSDKADAAVATKTLVVRTEPAFVSKGIRCFGDERCLWVSLRFEHIAQRLVDLGNIALGRPTRVNITRDDFYMGHYPVWRSGGAIAIVYAMLMCDSVKLYGFGPLSGAHWQSKKKDMWHGHALDIELAWLRCAPSAVQK